MGKFLETIKKIRPVDHFHLCGICFVPIPLGYKTAHYKWHERMGQFVEEKRHGT